MSNPFDFDGDGRVSKQDVGGFWTRIKALFKADPVAATIGAAIVLLLGAALTKMFF